MEDDYEAMALVLRALGESPPGGLWTTTYLCNRAGLAPDSFANVIRTMRQRGWIIDGSFPGETFRLAGRGPDNVGRNAPQLLALDIVAWIKSNAKSEFLVRDVPAHLRNDAVLFELAVRELIAAEAVGPRHGGPIIDDTSLVVQPKLRLFEFGKGVPISPTHVQQHFGDVVGRDKITATGSGPVVTGRHNVVTINSDAAICLSKFVDALREQREVRAEALDVLQAAARPDLGQHEIVDIIADSATKEPRLIEKLKAFALGVPGHLVKSAIVEGIKQYLRVKGILS